MSHYQPIGHCQSPLFHRAQVSFSSVLMPCWATICIFLSDRFKCLILFTNLHSSSIILTLLQDSDQLKLLLVRCFGLGVSSLLLLCGNENLPCASLRLGISVFALIPLPPPTCGRCVQAKHAESNIYNWQTTSWQILYINTNWMWQFRKNTWLSASC